MIERKFTLPVGAIVTVNGENLAVDVGTVITIVSRAEDRIDEFVRMMNETRPTKEPMVLVVGDCSLMSTKVQREDWQKKISEALAEEANRMFLHAESTEIGEGTRRPFVVAGPQRQRAQWKDERNRKYRR